MNMNFEFSDSAGGWDSESGFQTWEFLAAGREKPLGFPIHFKCWHPAQILNNKAKDKIFVVGVCDHILRIKYEDTSIAKCKWKETQVEQFS